MNICFFSMVDFLEGNGANSRLKAYAKGLHASGVGLKLYFLRSTDFNTTGVNTESKGYWHSIPFNYYTRSTRVSRFLLTRIFQLLSGSLKSALSIIKHRKWMDAVYIYCPNALFIPTYVAAGLCRIPVVIEKTELESTRTVSGVKERLSKTSYRLDQFLAPVFARHLIVISENLRSFYSRSFNNAITLIPALVDLDRFKNINLYGIHRRIGYLGSFGAKDGVEGILEAFRNFSEDGADVELCLMGYNPQQEKLNQWLISNPVRGKITQTGQLLYDEIPERLAQCDVLIVNRTNAPYSHYGFPTKLTEYLATGALCVVSDVGDARLYMEDKKSAILIEPGNTEQLTQVFRDFYSDPDSFLEIRKNGRKACEHHFDYRRHIPALINVFRQLTPTEKILESAPADK